MEILFQKCLRTVSNRQLCHLNFFESFEKGIKLQKLTNRLHWFRAYYSQLESEITNREFLMDNELVTETDTIFSSLPILPKMRFFSCRNFIILKDKAAD
jgi:hypothetical protein